MSTQKFFYKPRGIEAIQWTTENLEDVQAFAGPLDVFETSDPTVLQIHGEEIHILKPNDWLIREDDTAEFIIYTNEAFLSTFDPAPGTLLNLSNEMI